MSFLKTKILSEDYTLQLIEIGKDKEMRVRDNLRRSVNFSKFGTQKKQDNTRSEKILVPKNIFKGKFKIQRKIQIII